MSNPSSPTAQLRAVDWRAVTLRSGIIGAALAAIVLPTAVLMTEFGRFLGWPASMIRMGTHVGIAIVSVPFILRAARLLVAAYRDDSDNGTTEGHTTEEIAIAATSNRRRHYTKQLLKAGVGLVLSLLSAVNVYSFLAMRSDAMGAFQSAFGSSATLNYHFALAMMVFTSLLGLGIAAHSWVHRYKLEDRAILDAMEELEDE